jgi:hypothetical protein
MRKQTLPVTLVVLLIGALFVAGAAAAAGAQAGPTDTEPAQEGNLTFTDQATASSTFTAGGPSQPGVAVSDVDSNVDSAVVVTYPQGDNLTIAGLDTFDAGNLTGGTVFIPVEDVGGFPGEHTAHLIPTANLSQGYAPGDNVSNETASAILDNEAATVFQGIVDFANQSFEDATTEVVADVAALQGDADTLFQVDLHAADQNGAPANFVGSSPVINGTAEEVSITLQDTAGNPLEFNTSDEYVAMIHVVDDENVSEGDQFPPGTFPVLPHASATGPVPGGVTDGGEVGIFSAEGAELAFDGQAVGVDEDGNAVVYVDNITEAEQVEQDLVSNPAEDFVVLYEGDTLTQDSLVDFRNVGDAEDGELLLRADNATPGEHTVELFADARSELDPTQSDVDVDVDHPFITDQPAESSTSADRSYILLLEEALSADASADRGTVVDQLQSQAAQAQQPVVERLDAMPVTVDSQFWIVNAVSVTVDSDEVSAADLERVTGVEHVVRNVEYQLPTPAGDSTAVSPDDVRAQQTYGLQQIDVPNFEDTFGSQGEGTTVAIIDNGIGTTDPAEVHPDINISVAASVVDGQIIEGELGPPGTHGLHTAGTATGAANPAGNVPRYGVAPKAELIKINSFAGGGSFLGDSLAGIQYSVGQGADVASLSLGLPPSSTGGLSNIELATEAATQNANDAGMSVVGAIGNEGSGPVGGPGGSPGPEFSTLGIGASDSNRDIASFSSGDVITPNTAFVFDQNFTQAPYPDTYPRSYVKPDVSAPGVQVLSAGPLGQVVAENPTYSLSQGTSMATPHVSGAIALIQSATDVEHSPKTIERALAETAEKPADAPGAANERDIRYGTGIINVTAATLAIQDTTNISGTVTDSATGETLTGVKITTDTGVVASTNENGTYSIAVTSNVSSVEVTADDFGYTAANQTVTVGSGDQTADFALDPELDVVPVAGQPSFTEFESNFTIVVDVRNLEEYGVELTNEQGVSPSDVDVTVLGQTISPGENVSLGAPTGANGVPVTVAVNGTFSEGDQFALAHTFSGLGEELSVTTGPTTLTETQAPAAFALSGFSAPAGQEIGQAEPYAVSVTVTNVGQTPGEAEIRWFLGPLGLQGDNPVESLAPGESAQVALNFGTIDVGGFFGDAPVNLLQGFDAVPTGPDASGDLTFEEFTIGGGQVPLLDPIDPSLPRGAAETTTVYGASVSIDNQSNENATSEVTVSSSSVLPDSQEYVIVVHENTAGLPVLGSSGDLNGTAENVTVSLDTALNETTDVLAMVHFAANGSAFGAPILAFDSAADGPAPVSDTATVEIQTATLTFGDQFVDGETVDVAAVQSDGAESAVVVTYPDGGELVISGLTVGTFDNETVQVALEDTGGLPGNHTAHIIPTDGLSQDYGPGDTVSAETAGNILDQETASVGIDVNGNGSTAADTTGDGLLNDINGDGNFDIFDVQMLFDNIGTATVQENPDLFDFSGIDDDRVSIFDIQGLFTELQAPPT